MRRILSLFTCFIVFISFFGSAHATLPTIGTATYEGTAYNLIYMNDGPFGPITWLDYTKDLNSWDIQVAWASGLGENLTVTLNPGYTTSIDWSMGWRLPGNDESKKNLYGTFGYAGPGASGYHNYLFGYNMINSEMGYLHYEALGNKGYYATDGTFPQLYYGLDNVGDFDHLQADAGYWSGTEYSLGPGFAWGFIFYYGYENYYYKDIDYYALAVRPGHVSVIPEPGTMLLLGAGLIGLAATRRKMKK